MGKQSVDSRMSANPSKIDQNLPFHNTDDAEMPDGRKSMSNSSLDTVVSKPAIIDDASLLEAFMKSDTDDSSHEIIEINDICDVCQSVFT